MADHRSVEVFNPQITGNLRPEFTATGLVDEAIIKEEVLGGQVLAFDSVSGKYFIADALISDRSKPRAIALKNGKADERIKILLSGVIEAASWDFSTSFSGDVFLSENGGVSPTAREVPVVIGLALTPTRFMFTPPPVSGSGAVGPEGPEGPAGEDGREVLLQTTATHIQWQYEGDESWTNLVALADLEGPAGPNGEDGREIELQVTATEIQWRYLGETSWTFLIALASLAGEDGPAGVDGEDGKSVEIQATSEYIQWRLVGDTTWINIVALSTLKGADGTDGTDGDDGTEIELQKTSTHVQWRYVGGSWINLVALADITGPQGIQGVQGNPGVAGDDGEDGTEIELQKTTDYIQWRYLGGSWTNLVALVDITGPAGSGGGMSQAQILARTLGC